MTFPGRLVVVDDDPHVLGALRFAFETEGYEVRTCANGEEVVAVPPREACTCLVIDQRLPGITGLETLARLRAKGVAAPAILITSHPSSNVIRAAAAANVEIVEKPLMGDVLARQVRAALAQAPSQPS
jgi:two-component system, LuxR family, response regulator FixJ